MQGKTSQTCARERTITPGYPMNDKHRITRHPSGSMQDGLVDPAIWGRGDQ